MTSDPTDDLNLILVDTNLFGSSYEKFVVWPRPYSAKDANELERDLELNYVDDL